MWGGIRAVSLSFREKKKNTFFVLSLPPFQPSPFLFPPPFLTKKNRTDKNKTGPTETTNQPSLLFRTHFSKKT
ncbi:hypothetical protein, partial [Escherichia coli]